METLTKELLEIDFHRERIRLTPLLIENLEIEIEYWDLYLIVDPENSLSDLILETRTANSKKLEYYSKEFAISKRYLEQRGIDPMPLSKEELKALQDEFPDPYRWRVPAWLRQPFNKLFKRA